MSTAFTQAQGTLSAAIVTMSTLASGTYTASSGQNLGSTIPLNKTIQVECTPSTTPSGNKKMDVFAQLSLDGTNYGSGPTSGTTTTNEADLHYIGYLPCNDSGLHRKMFSLDGVPVAQWLKIVVKNDMGVALTSGFVYWADVTGVGT
jgi:hypothetical protein